MVNLLDLSALGITDNVIFPHYEREDLFADTAGRTIEERLKKFEDLNSCLVCRVKDDQSIFMGIPPA